jgi:hypothetical protein
MLYVARNLNQSLILSLASSADPETPVRELFKDGPIRIKVVGVSGVQVLVSVQAPPLIDVRREDCHDGTSGPVGATA